MSRQNISGPALQALNSLSPSEISFLQSVPKAELHAHLNGSIPLDVLKELAEEYLAARRVSQDAATDGKAHANGNDNKQDGMDTGTLGQGATPSISDDSLLKGIEAIVRGPTLEKINDFFGLFPAIYALTSTRASLARVTKAVLASFLDPVPIPPPTDAFKTDTDTDTASQTYHPPQCAHLELRSTPRSTPTMSREEYVLTILDEMYRYPLDSVGLIVSLDRRMGEEVVKDCCRIACELREKGRRVVGVDLCGDPTTGDVRAFAPYFERAKRAGLGVTVHIAETLANTPEETLALLSYSPDRLGHATFLDDEAVNIVLERRNTCIEICLSSNLLCKTVPTLEEHHIAQYLKEGHPISICTDDTLPFRTSLLAEYALLLAKPPFGLGLTEEQVRLVGKMSLDARFK